jgi:hypothetical protein
MTQTTDQILRIPLAPDSYAAHDDASDRITPLIDSLPSLVPMEQAVARILLDPHNDPSQMAESPTDMVELYSMFTMPVASGQLETWPATGVDQVIRVLGEYFTRVTGVSGYFEADVSHVKKSDEKDETLRGDGTLASITLLTSINLSAGQWLSGLFRQDALRQVPLARYCAHPAGSALRTEMTVHLIPAITLATALVSEHARLIDTARRLIAQPDFAAVLNRTADEVIDALSNDTVPTDIINLVANAVLARLANPDISLDDVARTQYDASGLSELLTEQGLA